MCLERPYEVKNFRQLTAHTGPQILPLSRYPRQSYPKGNHCQRKRPLFKSNQVNKPSNNSSTSTNNSSTSTNNSTSTSNSSNSRSSRSKGSSTDSNNRNKPE